MDWGLTKNVIHGVAITSLIFSMSIYVPFLGSFGIYLLPLPIIFYRLKLGRSNGAIVPVVSMGLMAMIIGDITVDLLFFFELLLLGFIMAELMEWRLSIERTILYSCLAVVASGVCCLVVYSAVSHADIFSMVSEYISKSIDMVIAMFREMGMSEKDIQTVSSYRDSFQYVLVRIIPALTIATALITIWINILLARPLLKTKGIPYSDFGKLNTWKAPDHLVWGFIASGFMLILQVKPIWVIGLNGIIILMIIYFFQGAAIVSFYFEKKHFPRLLRFYIYTFAFIALRELLICFLSIIGLFDTWIDFRKLEKKINNQEN